VAVGFKKSFMRQFNQGTLVLKSGTVPLGTVPNERKNICIKICITAIDVVEVVGVNKGPKGKLKTRK
jgi:hypothetical protein